MPEIESIKNEYNELLKQLANPELISNWEKFEELSKEKEFLEKIIRKNEEIEELKNKIEENESIISAQEDAELIALAEAEITQLKEKVKILEKELQNERQEKDSPSRFGTVIVEIRAGQVEKKRPYLRLICSKCTQSMPNRKIGKQKFWIPIKPN